MEERKRLIRGIIAAIRLCKFVKPEEMTSEVIASFGSEDGVTQEEAQEVLEMKEAA